MNKFFYLLAFLTTFTLGIGAMFEFLTWPFRGIIVFVGFVLLNFGLVPTYFYQKYKSAEK